MCLWKKNHHQTGRGPLPKEFIYSDIIVDVFGEDSPAFIHLVGVESGGMDQPPENSVSTEIDVVDVFLLQCSECSET